jgi:(2R)-3-sulfolactate dehydrogenase (NADP+)
VGAARELGIAIFSQRNSYLTGELGYYVRRLTEKGLIAFAATNSNPVLAACANSPRVYGTNPLAFGFPMPDGREPIVIDQASSETALVNIIAAAKARMPIPSGWATGPDGEPTTDPVQGLAGALLPFGGRKGANIALMVELIAAGISGADWSVDAADFSAGDQSPCVGLTVVAMRADGSPGAIERASDHVDRLAGLGVYVPGRAKAADRDLAISATVHETLKETIRRGSLSGSDR